MPLWKLRIILIIQFLVLLTDGAPPFIPKSRGGRRRLRTSGRLLAKPNPVKCSRRPRQLLDESTGHYYFFSEDSYFKGNKANWLDARNLCRELCMDLISIESPIENELIQQIIAEKGLRDVWTSGRLCNFKGCDKPHLQPRNVNGWFWSGSGERIYATNSTPPGWPEKPWSRTGYIGQFLENRDVPQPDNAEYLLKPDLVNVEACLSINNNWYDDGIAWHDSACYRKKSFICEDSEPLMRKARSYNPNIKF
ncbi:unnamed protein product [Lepeophtheirus salmonis]|uniref:(salmon louse) hypothetical protein n=2 Tax=Lepeophtheirus salmonis TaxID=72036 RepID=A0A7R8D307_LEPSM|nr:unnamed protein product [Lepeophtheirus salmonis]CAF3011869.1 unnamed protein product [Lepeophtheirus salmonis]